MTLYEMLDKTLYYQTVWIFEHNAYDQNMPLFRGRVEDARKDTERVWNYLMCEVEHYEYVNGILDIRVRDEYYELRFEEGNYTLTGRRWGRERNSRPWLYSAEIDADKGGEQE